MTISLARIIFYVQDVGRLTRFYKDILGLPLVQEIKDEWAVFRAGSCELALHRVGRQYRVADAASWKVETNVKLVLVAARPIGELRAELISKGVRMREIKSYPGFPGPLCDGEDPEGNVFQLQQG
jgi:catechol 2,3-dioxygenase-like lactoylglutathione lyase family enzyme